MSQATIALLNFASPFHVCCDREWNVVGVGPSMAEHLTSDPIGQSLGDILEFQRPKLDSPTGLNNLAGQLILFTIKASGLDLRGQWEDMPWPGLDGGVAGRVLLCSPWVTGEDQWRKTGLKLRQLGPQDGSGEYLLLLAAAREQALDVERLAVLATAREKRLEALFQHMGEGMLLVNPKGQIESVNPAACKLLGYAATDLEGRNVSDHFSTLSTGKSTSANKQWTVKKSDGGSFKARGSQYTIRTAHELTEALLFRDVTEEEHLEDLASIREARLEALVQRMREGLLLINNEGRIESANPAASALLGRKSDEIEDSPLSEHFTTISSNEGSSENLEWVVQKQNGGSFKARGSRYGIRTSEGRSEALLFRDTSEEEQALQMRRTFLSMVSHELRTPLSAIKAPLGMSLSGHLGELSPKVRDVLEIASRNADRLHQLVDDVIDIERLESNALPMHPSEFKTSALTQKLLDGLGGVASDAQVHLDIDDEAFSLVADQGRILQVLTNLVGNAIRHSPKQGKVHLRMLQRDSNARCEVTDEGPGIPPELRSRIFDRFFQVSSGSEQPTGGTGLGLAISRLIVAQHGGRIGVVKGPRGCGSTFWLELPLAGL